MYIEIGGQPTSCPPPFEERLREERRGGAVVLVVVVDPAAVELELVVVEVEVGRVHELAIGIRINLF